MKIMKIMKAKMQLKKEKEESNARIKKRKREIVIRENYWWTWGF